MKTALTVLVVLLLSAEALAQNTTAPVAAHSVVYVEVKPAAKSQALTAFKTYAAAAKTQSGFSSVELFEQRGRPGHYVLIESWRDQGALEAQTAAQAELATALLAARLSEIDRRPYKTLDTAAAKATTGKAVYVISHVDAAPPSPAVTELLQLFVSASRAESGSLRVDLLQHQQRANHYTLIEVWRDEAALQAHVEAAHTLRFRDQFGPFAGSPLDERLFDAVPL